MFDQHVIDIIKRNERRSIPSSGEPYMMKSHIRPLAMRGGIRYGAHPVPQMDFQPDTLATGDELYKPSARMGATAQGAPRRIVGGKGQRILSSDSGLDLQGGMQGGSLKSFGRKFMKGLKSVGRVVTPVLKEIGKEAVPILKDFAIKEGKNLLKQGLEEAPMMLAAGRKKRGYGTPPSGHDKRASRGLLIRKLMQQHGFSLAEASRYIKEKGLKY